MPQNRLLALLPPTLSEEILRLKNTHVGNISELRLRLFGLSTLKVGDSTLRLRYTPDRQIMDSMVERLSGGALYAHRDTIARGYISLDGGIRVGIVGRASYEGDRLVGISNISSLLFRLPTGECAFREELVAVYRSGIDGGLIIYSPPGVGKTTAIRTLAGIIGREKSVSVVDERCEFIPEDYLGLRVDILRGYKRAYGIELATRTMAPEVILTDELSGEDISSVQASLLSGIPLVATVHAGSIDEIRAKPSLRPILTSGAFSTALGISRVAGKYIIRKDNLC